MFLICISIYILWKFFQYTLHWDKMQQMLKKLSSDEKNIQQMHSFFLSGPPTHHGIIFNLQFLYELKYMVHLSETAFGIFHFAFRLFFIKLYTFVQQKSCTLSFKNKNTTKATHSFARIFKLQQEVWKFDDTCVSWCKPKTDLETNFLNF